MENPANVQVSPAPTSPLSKLPAPTADEIQRWIADLGNDSYAVRQQAAERLLAAGAASRSSLVELASGPDPETRAAAKRLIALIDKSEFHRRLEGFAADTDGRLGLTLPGWESFQKLVGGDADARALFVEMQRQEATLLASMFDASKPREDLLEARLQRASQWQPNVADGNIAVTVGSIAAMVFVGTLAEATPSDAAVGMISALVQRVPVRENLKPDNSQKAIRKLVVAWLVNCPNKSESSVNSRLNAVGLLGLDETISLPLAIVSGEAEYAQLPPVLKANAAITIGQLGNRSHVDRLEPLLNDASVYQSVQQENIAGQTPANLQVRDAALVVMLRLTDQSPAEYGYIAAQQLSARTFSIQPLANGDQRRADAIAKWRRWRAEHPDGKNSGADKKEEKPAPTPVESN